MMAGRVWRAIINWNCGSDHSRTQIEEFRKFLNLLVDWKNTFVRVVLLGQQEEQRFATE
jgi:hypothetical protein